MASKGYKYKSLRVFSSSEWMVDSTKKYRRVFDKSEISYLRAELSFYNKKFDEEDWKAKVRFKATETSGNIKKEICNLEKNITVLKNDNIVNVYESWGVENPGGYWKAGTYTWEAYIDDKLIGTQEFYIYDIGLVTQEDNTYFEFVSLKLYEGGFDAWNEKDRKYLKEFSKSKTRYVWAELSIKNKTNKAYNLEYFINFYDDAGQYKAKVDTIKFISNGNKDKVFVFERGWGNTTPGSWKDDKYSVEVVFMDTLTASVTFTMGENYIEGELNVSQTSRSIESEIIGEEKETLEDLLKNFESLIGLNNIKQKVKDHISYIDFLKLRREKGFNDTEEITLHSVFTGNPGTGKTTVVKLLGKIYQRKGLLSKGHVHEVDRAELVGEFIGQTAPKVKEAIKEARGGILFIDEAYMLARSKEDKKDFGKEVIEVLVKEMSDGEKDIAVMMAGYPKETMFMINSNPGLKSRIKYFFHFDDYTPDELHEIAHYATDKRNVKLTEDASELLKKTLTEAYRNRDHTFGNARFAYSLIDEGKMNMGLRLMQSANINELTNEELSVITSEDISKIESIKSKSIVKIPVDFELLKEATDEMNALIGMNDIKNEVNELIKLVKFYKETGKDVLNKFSLHAVFSGNPGTGKTTLARIFGKIYKALGLLERGHIIETGREGLVAGYVGQTAIKTKEKIDEAIGGVLFIDEAYALAGGSGQHSYGNEAIEVILKNMEDNRGKFAVIVAGYPGNMDTFLKMNPGLKSRFDKTLIFKDYNPDILYDICVQMLKNEELFPDKETEVYLRAYIKNLYKKRDRYFGNARTVRKIVQEALRKQNLRMASVPSRKRTKEALKTLTVDDVKDIEVNKALGLSDNIGF
ncbi:MAG: AAA family ATPase [Bacteroidales bacterium]|nr:AAA family ATPase [Bacteroidales bacterium]